MGKRLEGAKVEQARDMLGTWGKLVGGIKWNESKTNDKDWVKFNRMA
jgi:hypothetical protein